ncbi:hypothetical protein [Spirosoma gilvum]
MIDKGEFLLMNNSIKNNIELSYNELKIELTPNPKNEERLRKLKSLLKLTAETSSLIIDGPAEQGKLLEIAIDIKNLLSIALGRRVTFDRQIYWNGQASNLEEREMSKNENKGEQIIPDFEIAKYLSTTLPIWTNLSKIEKDDIFTITDYLNQTRHGFIEDRILRVVQAWECSAYNWTQEPALPEDLVDLKEKIKAVYRIWKDENNYNDINGELGTRLTAPLDQEKLMLRLQRLLKDSGLNTNKIKLDLKTLKNLRDQVAHTGRIKIKGEEAINYLQPGVKGLQLIILKRLGFDGKVRGEKDGWATIEDIKDYFV